jgi:hypothetical protein
VVVKAEGGLGACWGKDDNEEVLGGCGHGRLGGRGGRVQDVRVVGA